VTAPAQAQLTCCKRENGQPCPGTPVVRYFVGPVCAAHQIPGAESYGSLVTGEQLNGGGVITEAFRTDRPVPTATAGAVLPDAGRRVAASHADAAPGEANAAKLAAYRAGSIRARVLEHLVEAGQDGTTAIEAWRWYCRVHVPGTERYSVAPRLSELVADGWAVKTGGVRNVRGTAYPPEEVYRLSSRGARQLGVTR
jgi:hypothetical protein